MAFAFRLSFPVERIVPISFRLLRGIDFVLIERFCEVQCRLQVVKEDIEKQGGPSYSKALTLVGDSDQFIDR